MGKQETTEQRIILDPDGTPMREVWRLRKVGEETRPAGWFLANSRNWRIHPQAQRQALRGVLSDLGWLDSVKVNLRSAPEWGAEQGVPCLWDGHARIEESLKEGDDTAVPLEYYDLTPTEEAEALATFDPLSALAGTDTAQLDALLREVSTGDAAVQQMLATMAEEAGIVPPMGEGDGGDDFDATPEDGPTRTQAGELWLIGGVHRLIVGDSTDPATVARLMGGERADIVFTSPPYNLGENVAISNRAETLKAGGSAYVGHNDTMSGVAYFEFLSKITDAALAHADYLLLNVQQLAGNKVAIIEWLHKYRAHFADVAVWTKTNPQPAMAERVMNSAFEYIYFLSSETYPTRAIKTASFRGTVDNVYAGSVTNNEFSDLHGATFPLEFAELYVKNFSQNSVIDLFGGTGTTLVAAHRTGRRAYLCELSPRYADVILRRAEAEGLTCERAE